MEINLRRWAGIAHLPSAIADESGHSKEASSPTVMQRSASSPGFFVEFLPDKPAVQACPDSPRLAQEIGSEPDKPLANYLDVFSGVFENPIERSPGVVPIEHAKEINISSDDVLTPKEAKRILGKLMYTRYARNHAANLFDECRRLLANRMKATFPGEAAPSTFDSDGLGRLALGATHFHGSRSASLRMFDTSSAGALAGRLMPTGQLLAAGGIPFSGELANALDRHALNENHVSVVDQRNISTAYDYACKLHAEKWMPSDAASLTRPQGAFETAEKPRTHLEDTANYLADRQFLLAQSQLNSWNSMADESDAKMLVELNFPTLYGVQIPETASREKGGMPGEIGVRNGFSANEIRVIFVPEEHVAFVSSLVQKNGFSIPVRVIADLKPFL